VDPRRRYHRPAVQTRPPVINTAASPSRCPSSFHGWDAGRVNPFFETVSRVGVQEVGTSEWTPSLKNPGASARFVYAPAVHSMIRGWVVVTAPSLSRDC
jgi:hypothetical protein